MDYLGQPLPEDDSRGRRQVVSFAQEQLWFLDQMAPGEPTYNIVVQHRIGGPLDAAALTGALNGVVRRHEVLRATFDTIDGQPFQVIASYREFLLPFEDLSALSPDESAAEADRVAVQEATTPFNLSAGPLFRFRLLRLSAERHLLCMTVHHIVADGWSMGLLDRELSTMYRAQRGEPSQAPPELALQYGDFAARQRRRLEDHQLDDQLRYWEEQLKGLVELELPTDRPRPAVFSYRGDQIDVDLPGGLLTGLRQLARGHSVSMFMVLTTAFATVLARYTGQDEVPIGTTMLARTEPALENLVGFFVNMVVLRNELSGDPTFAELLTRTRDLTLAAYDHQEVPFEKVVSQLRLPRDPSRNPLFQASIQLLGEGTSGSQLDLPESTVETLQPGVGRSHFDLGLTFVEADDRLTLRVEYATDLFDSWRIERMIRHLENVLAAAVRDPSVRVSEVALLSEVERDEILALGQGPEEPFRVDPVHVAIADRARSAPDALAAVFEGRQLTYGELDHRAESLARHLRTLGVGHGDVVAVALPRGLDAWTSLLAVLKAGCAFVVLDTTHPAARLAFILADAGARLVITNTEALAELPEPAAWTPICLDQQWEHIEAAASAAVEPLAEWATADSLAYVLYTSGSTGEPKGVLVEHRAVLPFLTSFIRILELGPQDRMLQFSSLAFDMSEAEIFSALLSGAALVSASRETLTSPESLSRLMRDEQVTYVGATPSVLMLVDPKPYPRLRNVLVGGEACPPELVNRWNMPGRRFINGYGPTEAAICCTLYICAQQPWRNTPPIGRPLSHRRMYVVDRWGNLCPIGVAGELLIGGDEGLARGYLNRRELTEQRFIPEPFRSSGRAYRSGDLVRWTIDGQIDFVGRIDTQIKLRGLRIELEEIEAVAADHPEVAHVAVALREDVPGDKRLIGYVVPAEAPPPVADLRDYLCARIPPYMVPSGWVFLDELPLSASGKVQRAALPAPGPRASEADRSFVPPATAVEQAVADIFGEILSESRVGRDDDFFLLGGDSLRAMRVVSRVSSIFNVLLRIRTLYVTSTVRDLADHITNLNGGAGPDTPSHSISPGRLELLSRIEALSEDDAQRLLSAHGTLAGLRRPQKQRV